jgi:2-polyprenyl-3-methyl-5-hydroxy-6-metoxy-1,4-benzoquinol methylase
MTTDFRAPSHSLAAPLEEDVLACPLCAAPAPFPLAFRRVRCCPACGVHFLSPRPTTAAVVQHYDRGATYDLWRADREARERMWRRRLKFVRALAASGTLLDVGTGDGHFLDVAKSAGYTVTGTEVSIAGAEAARARGHQIFTGQLGVLDLPERSFDIVTMWHVLEHAPNPGGVLTRVFQLLRPGGVLMIAVPNERMNLRRGAAPQGAGSPFGSGTFDEGEEIHLTFFTPATLAGGLRRAGFEVHRVGVDNVYLQMSLLRRVKLGVHRITALATGSHLGMAMRMSARKP